ncbi:MAG: multidrug effflux MFS transporter [Pseudomonadota bacterium]
MSHPRTPPALVTLILLAGLSPLSLNMFMPSLVNMAVSLETDYATISLVVSASLAVTAVIQLIVGPLSDRIGRRPVLVGAMALFALASVGCYLAQDVTTFLIARILQGGVTAGYTLSMAIVRDTRSPGEAQSLIGYIGMSMAIAPIIGPVAGGMMDAAFGWRMIFAFYAVAGFGLFALCWFDLGETRAAGQSPPLAQALELLRAPAFWAFALCGAFSVGAFYIFLAGAPLVAGQIFGISTATLGVYIGSITMGFMAGGFFAGRFGRAFTPARLMLIGRVIACTGLTAGLIVLSTGVREPLYYFAATICVGLGNGITTPGSTTGAMSVRPELSGSAAGVAGALIIAGGAVLTAITGQLVQVEGGEWTLLALMLGASFAGLLLALWAGRLSRER